MPRELELTLRELALKMLHYGKIILNAIAKLQFMTRMCQFMAVSRQFTLHCGNSSTLRLYFLPLSAKIVA